MPLNTPILSSVCHWVQSCGSDLLRQGRPNGESALLSWIIQHLPFRLDPEHGMGEGCGRAPFLSGSFPLQLRERERERWGRGEGEREKTLNISTDHKLFITREKNPNSWFSEPIKCPRIWPLKRVLLVGNVPRGAGRWGTGGRHRSWELPFASRVSAIPHFTEEETELLRDRK